MLLALHTTLYGSGAAGVVGRRCGLCRGWNPNLHLFVWAYHCSVCKPATSVSKTSLMGLALCASFQLVLCFSFAALYRAPRLRCRKPGPGGPWLRCSLLHRALGNTWAASLFAAAVGSTVRAADACARLRGRQARRAMRPVLPVRRPQRLVACPCTSTTVGHMIWLSGLLAFVS